MYVLAPGMELVLHELLVYVRALLAFFYFSFLIPGFEYY